MPLPLWEAEGGGLEEGREVAKGECGIRNVALGAAEGGVEGGVERDKVLLSHAGLSLNRPLLPVPCSLLLQMWFWHPGWTEPLLLACSLVSSGVWNFLWSGLPGPPLPLASKTSPASLQGPSSSLFPPPPHWPSSSSLALRFLLFSDLAGSPLGARAHVCARTCVCVHFGSMRTLTLEGKGNYRIKSEEPSFSILTVCFLCYLREDSNF